MKDRIQIKNIKEHSGKEVLIAGFAQTVRSQSKIAFIILRDITGTIQLVIEAKSEAFETARDISTESVLEVRGLVKEEAQAPGGYEIAVSKIEVLSQADPVLPIPVIEQKGADNVSQDNRFDHRWLDLRRSEKSKIFKVWNELEKGFRKYWNDNDFLQIYTPSLMSSASESGSEVFEVKYFDRKAYLAQSPQFYKQMAIASGFEKVFMVGPVFRAEPSFTTRHMTEFTGWDFEMSYVESHHDIMDNEEGMIVSGFQFVKDAFPEIDIDIPKKPFPRMTIQDLKTILAKEGVESKEEHDLSPEEERSASEIVKREYNSDFLFVIDYHISKRPFYHMRHADNPELTKSADLLYRGLEITTLAQREHRVDILEAQAREKNMDLESLKDYMNFFRYGCPPHGGAGIGPGRIIMKILDIQNVKDAAFLPRDVNRLKP